MTTIVPLDPVPAPDAEADTGAHRDPLSGEVGAHPVGVGLGAAAGGMAFGAAVGTVAGPIGMALGALVGAVAGGLAGKGAAELMAPTAEDAYWRANYASRAYATPREADSDWGPAYGRTHHHRNRTLELDNAESGFDRSGDASPDSSIMEWTRARLATDGTGEQARPRKQPGA